MTSGANLLGEGGVAKNGKSVEEVLKETRDSGQREAPPHRKTSKLCSAQFHQLHPQAAKSHNPGKLARNPENTRKRQFIF